MKLLFLFLLQSPASEHREVTISPGQSIQAAADAAPGGTTFRIKAGIHRLQKVKPKEGDKFLGQSGAILSGAKILSASDFIKSSNCWYVAGQTQRLPQPFGTNVMIPGYECDLNPEELFVNGDRRLKRVCALSELGPAKWYFDYKHSGAPHQCCCVYPFAIRSAVAGVLKRKHPR